MKNSNISKGEAVPFLWLGEAEADAQADACGCVLVRDYNNGGPAFFLCTKHAAASDLLTALKKIAEYDSEDETQDSPKAIARAAISKAKGDQ